MARILLIVTMLLLGGVLVLRALAPELGSPEVPAAPRYELPAEQVVLIGASGGLAVLLVEHQPVPQRRALENAARGDKQRFDIVFENHSNEAQVIAIEGSVLSVGLGQVKLAIATDASLVWTAVNNSIEGESLAPGMRRRCTVEAERVTALTSSSSGTVSGVALQARSFAQPLLAELETIRVAVLLQTPVTEGAPK